MKLHFDVEPCAEAAEWLETQPDIETAWKTCERGDWMWWALEHLPGNMPSKETSVVFANWCAERAKNNDDGDFYSVTATWASHTASATIRGVAFGFAGNAAYFSAYSGNFIVEKLAQADWLRAHVACPVVCEEEE